MKFGIRTPSLRKIIAARTSVKRIVRNKIGIRAARGMGWVTNSRKAAYNRVYNQTSRNCLSMFLLPILIIFGTFFIIVR
jgi:hypothetical protein